MTSPVQVRPHAGLPPSPGEWLNDVLRKLGYSRARAGSLIGRDRKLITRWANGRERIPRAALRELASVLAPNDANYVVMLDEFADEQRLLAGDAREVGRRLSVDADALMSGLISPAARASQVAPREAMVLEAVSVAVAARFTLRTVDLAVSRAEPIISRENIARHLRFPTNLALQAALDLDLSSPAGPSPIREVLLADLRRTLEIDLAKPVDRLVRHHALHMLGRCGEPRDRSIVSYELEAGMSKDDPVARKLGYCGLMMAPGGQGLEIADEFQWLLGRDEYLSAADLAFDATHYGDMSLGTDGDLRHPEGPLPRLAENIARHFLEPNRYGQIAEADASRMLGILDRGGTNMLGGRTLEMLSACLDADLIPSGSHLGRELQSRLKQVFGSAAGMSLRVRVTEATVRPDPVDLQHKLSHWHEGARTGSMYVVVQSGGIVNTGDQYNNNAEQIEIGAQGSRARVEKVFQKQHAQILKVDSQQLIQELRLLRQELQERASRPADFRAVADVSEAIEAAEAGDRARVSDRLQAAGKYALEMAKSIGTNVAAEAIKKSMGL